MARVEELRRLYGEALDLGEQLLKALQGSVTDESLDEVARLVEARAAVSQRTTVLFRSGDEAEVRAELQRLLQQQRAIESQMATVAGTLKEASGEAGRVRSTMGGVRRLLKADPKARWINELL